MFPIFDKVAAGGYAGLATTVVVGVLSAVGVTLPATVVAAIVFVLMFAVSYLKTETKAGAKVVQVADDVLAAMESEGPAR